MIVAMDALGQIIGDYKVFLRTVLEDMAAVGFDISDFVQMDHVCYRTVSQANYEAKKIERLFAIWLPPNPLSRSYM